MRIKRICYPVEVLGPGKRAAIWVTGCRFNCPGCTSPELQDFNAGSEIEVSEILHNLQKLSSPPDGITISGGEPFEQEEELAKLTTLLCENLTDDIIVYTGYTLEQLNAKNSKSVNTVLKNIAVLIDGQYIEALNDGKGLRGSSNQRIHIFKRNSKYAYMADCERKLQAFHYPDNSCVLVGLLP